MSNKNEPSEATSLVLDFPSTTCEELKTYAIEEIVEKYNNQVRYTRQFTKLNKDMTIYMVANECLIARATHTGKTDNNNGTYKYCYEVENIRLINSNHRIPSAGQATIRYIYERPTTKNQNLLKDAITRAIADDAGDDKNYQNAVNRIKLNPGRKKANFHQSKKKNTRTSIYSGYTRDPEIAAHALYLANYKCAIDPDNHKSFQHADYKRAYMEPHHLIHMAFQHKFSNKNIDIEDNIFSLCRNCHGEIHYGQKERKIEMTRKLYTEREDYFHDMGLSYQYIIDLIFGKNC